jgi:Lrp/AsnC family transcriptional regulator for asnA, asnC and gidA
MSSNYELDEIDRKILKELLKDSRKSYQDIANELIVSSGTIHVRLTKMREAGIVQGSKIIVDFSKLGLEVCAYVGVNLVSARDYPKALEQLKQFNEITEVHYTTGQYSMFVKVYAKSTKELHMFLIEKLQSIPEIRSTETFISLDNPISRDLEVD